MNITYLRATSKRQHWFYRHRTSYKTVVVLHAPSSPGSSEAPKQEIRTLFHLPSTTDLLIRYSRRSIARSGREGRVQHREHDRPSGSGFLEEGKPDCPERAQQALQRDTASWNACAQVMASRRWISS